MTKKEAYFDLLQSRIIKNAANSDRDSYEAQVYLNPFRARVLLGISPELRETQTDIFADTPPEFAFPVIAVEFWAPGQIMKIATPYGIQPDLVKAADGQIYRFKSSYYYSSASVEWIKWMNVGLDSRQNEPEADTLQRIFGHTSVYLPRLDFTPNEADSSYAKLNRSDRAMLSVVFNSM